MRPLATCWVLASLVALALLPAAADGAGGSAMGWGYNASGQVGNGAVSEAPCYCIPTPTPIQGVSEVAEIAGGYEFGLALLADGRLMSWGYNNSGELGDGTTNLNPVPTVVPSVSGVIAVAGGTTHAMALLSDGSILAWGQNNFGELGLGSNEGPETCGSSACSRVPVKVPGVSEAIAIAADEYFSMALLADGTVLGWGQNTTGQVGDGVGTSVGCKCVPAPKAIPGVAGAVAIAAAAYTGAALLMDGTVRNWGRNDEGQLGTGQLSPSVGCVCLPATSPAGQPVVGWLSSAGDHTVVMQRTGGLLAWGYNYYGQIGNGSEPGPPCYCVPTPSTVSALEAPVRVDAGDGSTFALLADGTLRSWGSNAEGQLGTGNLGGVARIPVAVAGVTGASDAIGTEYNGYAIIGPSQALAVEIAGDGVGAVGGRGISCPPDCGERFPQAQVPVLRVEPVANFAGFTGPCTGRGACKVKMDGDQTVTATFGRPKGTRIVKAKINRRKRKARFTFTAPGAITGYQCSLVRKPVRPAATKSKKKRKPKPRFSTCNSPRRYKKLKPGRYVFRVRAVNLLGADALPAKRKFKLKKR